LRNMKKSGCFLRKKLDIRRLRVVTYI